MSSFRVLLVARRKGSDKLFPAFIALPYDGPPAERYDFHPRGFGPCQHAWQAGDHGTLKTGRDYARAAALGIL